MGKNNEILVQFVANFHNYICYSQNIGTDVILKTNDDFLPQESRKAIDKI